MIEYCNYVEQFSVELCESEIKKSIRPVAKNTNGKAIEAWSNQNWKQIHEADAERVKRVRTSRYGFGPTSEWREQLSVETFHRKGKDGDRYIYL